MTTALGIITKAMQKAGILTKSESPAADEASDALDALNDLLASWSNDSLMIYARVFESFSLSSGVASYTIGTGQTFNTIRPIFIAEAHVRQNVIDYPVTVIPDEVYQGIQDKTTQGTPQFLNYTNGFPTATINLWPVPTAGFTLFLTSEKELSQLTLNQTISLPPGSRRALIYNLSVEIAPEYGQPIDPAIQKIANDAKAAIARSIAKNRTMDAQPAGARGGFSIYRGY